MDPITLGILGLGAYLLFKPNTVSTRFRYRKRNGSWRAYFNGNPPTKSHVLHDSDGYYVCWDRPLRNEQEAKQIAKEWMNIYG